MDAQLHNIQNENAAPRLVIRLNAFTHQIDDGYLMQHGKRVGDFMSSAEIAFCILDNAKIKIEILKV